MSADNSIPSGPDRTRIDINDDYEVQGWSRKFGVSPEALKAAVRAVGTHAATVEFHLKGQQNK